MPVKHNLYKLQVVEWLRKLDLYDKLKAWLREKLFVRGMEYFIAGKARDLAFTGDGRIIATVRGSTSYVSALYLDQAGNPACECTCPHDGPCKHIAALACAAQSLIVGGGCLPACPANDPRLRQLESLKKGYKQLPAASNLSWGWQCSCFVLN